MTQSNVKSIVARKWKVADLLFIASCALVNFSCYLYQAILARHCAIFLLVAKGVDLSESEMGAIFGVSAVSPCICSFVFGRQVGRVGARLMLCGGIGAIDCCNVLFASIYFVRHSRNSFGNLSLLIRALEGMGKAAATIS